MNACLLLTGIVLFCVSNADAGIDANLGANLGANVNAGIGGGAGVLGNYNLVEDEEDDAFAVSQLIGRSEKIGLPLTTAFLLSSPHGHHICLPDLFLYTLLGTRGYSTQDMAFLKSISKPGHGRGKHSLETLAKLARITGIFPQGKGEGYSGAEAGGGVNVGAGIGGGVSGGLGGKGGIGGSAGVSGGIGGKAEIGGKGGIGGSAGISGGIGGKAEIGGSAGGSAGNK